MWLLSTSIAFITWAMVSIFYKITNKVDEYTHLKTGILVGLIMGIHALCYMIYKGMGINFLDVIKYFPISVLYIASMIIGYRGYKFIELSISSPVQNSSGVITALLFVLFFHEKYNLPFYIAVVLIFIGVIILSIDEIKGTKDKREEFKKNNGLKKLFTLAIVFPLFYALFDGVGTFLDGVFLDKLELINADSALISYEFTFFVYGMSVIFTQSIGPFNIFFRLRAWAERVGPNFGLLFKCMTCFPTNVGWVFSLFNWFVIPTIPIS